MEYTKHKYNIYPEMAPDEYAELKADIANNGYDNARPIYIYKGGIIDGWNRYKACKELSVTPAIKAFQGNDKDALDYVLSSNKRRNLSSSQRAAIAVEADEIVQAIEEAVEAERRAKIAERENTANQYTQKVETRELIPPSPKRDESKKEAAKSRTKIAETFGTNPRYISDAKRLKEENPEAFEKIKAGETTITKVKKEIKKEQRKQDIEKQKQDIARQNLPKINTEFDILVFDPPWPYGREYDPEGSRVANPYPEMSIQEIKNINVPDKDNSIMFLWTTHQFLPDAFEILKYWGYSYKATMVWNKEKIGMGYWLRMQCEFCLLAVKGKPIWDITDWRDIFSEPRREHSRKPNSFFHAINKYFSYASKLEYFSREKREGWSVYGNDINKF